ncbi:cytochrome P450 [Suillus fuscotomentosus]|uniref:Cytochrome P450 n=1 Tax=Suillus fuscotomentosus TaxID=1912939 RepID=A0AAD4HD11_9AGAM|nr:cytochrome P450 [Suillus fuscotomentosus]KAG1889792.1 cytochrome P450 [Suillus fuscotomentosus]
MSTFTVLTLLYICLAGVGVFLDYIFAKKNPQYPPGPRGLPLVGNIQDIPFVKPWLTFAEWGKKYGDISHASVLGMHIFVLNSAKTAVEMLDKKSSIYSDRPVVPMSGELMGYGQTLPYLRYGERFRSFRKNFHRALGSRAALVVYHPIEEMETHRFLKRVLAKPDQLQAHIRHTAGAIILRICYGYEVKENKDPLVDIAERTLDEFSRHAYIGEFMVDFLPSLAKVPEWFPGAGFKRIARECRVTVEEMAAIPYKFVKDQMVAGIAPKSFSSDLLKNRTLTAEEDHIVKWSAVSLFSAGADTTVSAIYSFFLAMTLFPDVQKKAQAEIDAVVGPDRLPSFADRTSLPYIEALVKEVLRWNVVIPTVDHSVTEDDIHDGYHIPKGSVIIPNIWFMLNDPQTYVNPSEFNHERFLAKDGEEPETDPRTLCFGFGRRLCPGLHLADASIWLTAAMSLAVFDVSKVVENGVEITPEIDPSSGLISHPKPFKCSIEARSERASTLIIQQDT